MIVYKSYVNEYWNSQDTIQHGKSGINKGILMQQPPLDYTKSSKPSNQCLRGSNEKGIPFQIVITGLVGPQKLFGNK